MQETVLPGVDRIALTPTTWAKFPHADEVRPLDDNDYEILIAIKDVLTQHKALDRFGINLIHRHFNLNQDEILFENTDEGRRLQTIDVRPASDIKSREDVLETQWVFNSSDKLVCLKYCDYNSGHRHIHQFK